MQSRTCKPIQNQADNVRRATMHMRRHSPVFLHQLRAFHVDFRYISFVRYIGKSKVIYIKVIINHDKVVLIIAVENH